MPQVACFLFCLLLVATSAFAFLSRSGRSGRLKKSDFCDSIAKFPEFEPNRPGFFDDQLDICRSIIAEDRNSSSYNIILDDDLASAPQKRRRFKEHPRSTARFGEVLLHARDHASSIDEYQFAVYNAQSLVDYVETKLIESNNSLPVRYGLVDDVARSLTTTSLYKFRKLQLEIDRSGSDFTLEQYDLELIGRLYYSAIRRAEPYLAEVGLSCDHTGFTTLLALCRAYAASDSNNISSTSYRSMLPILSKAGERLDAALSNHFNAITVPGCRFFFSPRHGLGPQRSRSKHLIIAFSSLGNGIVRHEFGGSCAKLNNDVNDGGFDVLFVADPTQSWYQKDDRGGLNGFAQYSHRIKVASKSYKHISLIGDSMGGSGALLFAHLANNAVVAFSPQVDLIGDDHVSRDDMTPLVRQMFQSRLFESAEEAIGKGVKLFIHRGLERSDAHQTDLLMGRLGPLGTENIKVIVHSSCDNHQVAVHMKQKGQLLSALMDCLNTRDHSTILR